MKLSLRGFVLPIFLAASCGGGGNPGLPDQGTSDQGLDAPPPVASLNTEVSMSGPKAGQVVEVTCFGNGFNPTQMELVVREDTSTPAPAPADASPGEDASAGEPDSVYLGADEALPDLGLPEGVTRDGMMLRFTRVDVFTVACFAPDARMIDRSPAKVNVRAGSPASVETVVEPTTIKAGENVVVTCTGVDAYGNPLDSALIPVITPSTGVTILGTSVTFTKAGTYQIACGVRDSSVVDTSPVEVTVEPNLPRKILTTVTPDTFEAGGTATLSCRTVDFYDNPVPNFPVSVQVPKALTLTGKTLTGTYSGLYPVKCVPQTAEWKYFTLVGSSVTIVPGPPTKLVLSEVPKKPFYGMNETLTVTSEARDKYDNLIPEAVVQAPVDIMPVKGIDASTSSPTRVFNLKEEGIYRMTFRLAAWPLVFAELEVKVEGSGPLLNLEYPERGATISGPKNSITLRGTISDDVTGIASFKINGVEVNKVNIQPDGTFTYLLGPLHQGVNILVVEVTDGAGKVTSTTRGFQYSPKFYPPPTKDPVAAVVHDGAMAFLSRFFIDDGVHDLPPDDLATILEMIVANLDLGALLPNPLVEAGPYKITIPSITYNKPTFQLNLYDGGLHLVMSIPNVKVDILAVGRCDFIIDWCPDVSGNVTFNRLLAIADVDIGMDATGQLKAEMKEVQVQLGGMQVHLDGLIGTLLDGIINLLLDAFRQTLVDTLQTQIATMVNDLLSNLLSQLVIDQSIEIPALPGGVARSIRLNVQPSTLNVQSEGIDVALDGTISAVRGVTHDPLGSIGRADCLLKNQPVFELPWDQEVVIGAFDDLLNQALYAVWYSGALNLKITGADLGSVDLTQYGVEDLKVDLDFYLPPILTDCTEKRGLQAQIGDLYVWADLTLMGSPLLLGAFVQAAAEASLYLTTGDTGATAVAVRLDKIPALNIEIISINDDFPISKEDLMLMLTDQLLGPLLAGVEGKELFKFEIPSIDLSGLSPMLPPGLALNIGLTDLLRDHGYTVIKGLLEQPPAAP